MNAAKNLYQRLLDITAEAGALDKTGKTSYGDKYSYHKVDDVVDHLRPLLVKHGVLMLPSVSDHHLDEAGATKSGTTQWRAEAVLEITLVNVADPNDRVTVNGWGEGVDTSDKGVGKAISYALKNALLATFCLRGQPDVEAEHNESHGRVPPRRTTKATTAAKTPKSPLRELADLAEELTVPPDEVMKLAKDRFGRGPRELRDDEIGALIDRLRFGEWVPDQLDEAMPDSEVA